MKKFLLILLFFVFLSHCKASIPLVVNTWAFPEAAETAWQELQKNGQAIDALVEGCGACETLPLQCRYSVGFGGNPDENGETTLDALVFDGSTMNMGAVGGIRNVKNAIGVAKKVLENTQHSLLVGSLASDFAYSLGFESESLVTNYSQGLYETWKEANCQPNFWTNVLPDPTQNCGPYTLTSTSKCSLRRGLNPTLTNEIPQDEFVSMGNHDTIGMIVINGSAHVVAGTSTNGLNHKIAGRVGDSPIPGAGAYADNEVGAATCTGNGDIMMRFLPSFLAVELMRQGATPIEAAQTAIGRIAAKYPSFSGAIIVADTAGNIGTACNGMTQFPFAVMNSTTEEPVISYTTC